MVGNLVQAQQLVSIMMAVTKACIPMMRMSLSLLASQCLCARAHANIVDGKIFMMGRDGHAHGRIGVILTISRGVFDHYMHISGTDKIYPVDWKLE